MINFSDQFKNSEPKNSDILRAVQDMVEQNRQAMLNFMADNPCDAHKLEKAGFVFLGLDMEGEVWHAIKRGIEMARSAEVGA